MKTPSVFTELRDFLILWSTQSLSGLGTAMTSFALTVWVYSEQGTASSVTMLSVCSVLPSVLFAFLAGAVADRWDRKRIMLLSDTAAAAGTAAILLLYLSGALRIWHLYLINFLLSCMNAFQNPASYVAVSLLVPRKHDTRVSGLQSLSGSIITILAPALGGLVMGFGGLPAVLAIDLATFAAAFLSLLIFIKIPAGPEKAGKEEGFLAACAEGLRYLKEHGALLRIILFFSFINFISKMGGYGMLSPFVLSRTGGDEAALGFVQGLTGAGTMLGGALVAVMKPPKRRTAVIFLSCGISFLLGDIGQSLTGTPLAWAVCGFLSNLPLVFLNANLTALMRAYVPIEVQGRVFSARDTLQYTTIPFGLLLGGLLADHVFEPLMAGGSPVQAALAPVFGAGKGAGLAVMFFLVGVIGALASFLAMCDPSYRTLDGEPGDHQR